MRQWQTAPALQCAFPDDSNTPPPCPKFKACGGVPGTVTVNFFTPELFAGTGPFEERTVMTVPEAPVNQNDGFVLRQNDVWLAGKLLGMKPVA
ncbi:hypothetical protein SAMN05444273_11416 [Litoreibacter ascidiaceicola]|uniref:Uncharacterized protein n=1 Tax=Litoreibacter ascidiaceicola TaxID=1486859 RepID=A0A1M5ETL5_9RHOB|nr:hypothetical protein SAMN05444273_11416 [Litoreibacter ascidiaceicola]